jgi:hypothetical protein
MGFTLSEILVGDQQTEDAEIRNYFKTLIKDSLNQTYQSQLQELALDTGTLETPDNYFEIASREIDDLFIFKVQLPAGFQIPRPMTPEELKEIERGQGPIQAGQAKVEGVVYNGEKLRPVARINWQVPIRDQNQFQNEFLSMSQTALLTELRNPNIYPSSDPLHFANLLLQFAQTNERAAEGRLTCDNAESVLETYAMASKLYTTAEKKVDFDAVGSQSELHELRSKMNEARDKANILQLCREDETKSFEFFVEFSGFDPSSESLIRQAIERAQIEEVSRAYSDKPVVLKLSLEDDGTITLSFNLRFDADRYKRMTDGKVLSIYRGYHALSFEAYYPLMQRLILMRVALPQGTPRSLGVAFAGTNMSLNLTTLLGGYVSIRVDGRYIQDQKTIDLFYPNSVYFDIPGYEGRTLMTRSDAVFQDKGWIALGSCRTVDGSLTEDGLLNQFFEIPCQL